MAKIIAQVPGSVVNAALTYYSSDSSGSGFAELMQANPVIVALVVLSVTMLVITLILLFRLSAQKKAGEQSPRI